MELESIQKRNTPGPRKTIIGQSLLKYSLVMSLGFKGKEKILRAHKQKYIPPRHENNSSMASNLCIATFLGGSHLNKI